jgi:hypothetical protein
MLEKLRTGKLLQPARSLLHSHNLSRLTDSSIVPCNVSMWRVPCYLLGSFTGSSGKGVIFFLTRKVPVVTTCTTKFNTKKFYVLPTQCIYVFNMELRTNSDCFSIQHLYKSIQRDVPNWNIRGDRSTEREKERESERARERETVDKLGDSNQEISSERRRNKKQN